MSLRGGRSSRRSNLQISGEYFRQRTRMHSQRHIEIWRLLRTKCKSVLAATYKTGGCFGQEQERPRNDIKEET